MNKSELRRTYLEKRAALTSDERAGASKEIARRFFDAFDLVDVGKLHCYLSIDEFGEVDTSPIYTRIWTEMPTVQIVCPRVDRQADDLLHIEIGPDTQYTVSKWGIREPADGRMVGPEEIDLVLVPLLCLDGDGYRVGYGKGFYDRFLSRCRPDCVTVGLSYFPHIARIEDIREYDVPLDMCITPTELITF
jgi:5-formyltetrahydrofolate cyclo-ligase